MFRNVNLITFFSSTVTDSGGKIVYDPISQLDLLLKTVPENSPVLLFQHHPTTEDFYNNAFHQGWTSERLEIFRKLCESNSVVAICTGHFHRDELHWTGNIPLHVAPPISGAWGRQAAFRVYRYVDGRLSYLTRYL